MEIQLLLYPAQGHEAMMLSDVCHIHLSAGGVCGRPAGWRILADRAELGRPGSGLPLRVAGLGGGISWRAPTYTLLLLFCIVLVIIIIIVTTVAGAANTVSVFVNIKGGRFTCDW